MPALIFSHTGIILVHHYLKLLLVLFCQLSCLIGPQHFFENSYSLAFKLVLQNRFHGLSFTIVRLLSGQCVFLNFNLRLTDSLRTMAIYKLPPPQIIISVFSHCVLMSSTTKTTTDCVHLISF